MSKNDLVHRGLARHRGRLARATVALALLAGAASCDQAPVPGSEDLGVNQSALSESRSKEGGGTRPPQPPIDPLSFPGRCEAIPPPKATEAPGPLPSVLIAQHPLHQPPSLEGHGRAAVESVRAFLAWAAGSFPAEREDGRRVITAARDNNEVARALASEIEDRMSLDPTSALLAASVLGELRSHTGARYLASLLKRRAPQDDQLIDGERVAAHSLAQLQAKAVDGLAYMRDDECDRAVLDAVGRHPSRVVRAEAVRAFLFNNPEHGQHILSRLIRPDERPLLQRVEHVLPTDRPGDFNKRLAAFLATNPQLVPPDPRRKLTCAPATPPPSNGTDAPPIE
jgi:hypothetical protein